jgi:hypothetical protein
MASTPGPAIIDAFLDDTLLGDAISTRRELVRLTQTGCTKADGLGGPPKCQGDQAEGTLVNVLPILGPEGHYASTGTLDRTLGFEIKGLYAVYYVSEEVWRAGYAPAGEVALLFIQQEHNIPVTVHIDGGAIVRLDFHYSQSLESILEREAADFLLPPYQ